MYCYIKDNATILTYYKPVFPLKLTFENKKLNFLSKYLDFILGCGI